MQFYSGPLIHFLSGVDSQHIGGVDEDARVVLRRLERPPSKLYALAGLVSGASVQPSLTR
jgi:hypothetical protein